MTIPVILLNYNSSADCRKCVSFLKRQKGVGLEIIIVDNASADADRKEVEALCAETGCSFLPVDSNRGYNAGNNVGVRYAAEKGYEYALIANPDMEFPDENYVAALVNEMQKQPEAVACGSDIITPEGVHQNPKNRGNDHWFNGVKNIIGWHRKSKISTPDIPEWIDNPLVSGPCRCLNGCCLLLSMKFLKIIGFFDERTFLYGEEPILGRQVEIAGKKMWYTSSVAAVHHHVKSKEGSSKFRFKHWKHSQLLYIRHYSDQSSAGKLLSEIICHLYFGLLNLKSRI